MKIWRLKGIPDNPSGWLFRAAKNKALDLIRKNKFSVQFDFNDPERELLKSEYTLVTVMDSFWKEDNIHDNLLQMMFACCHPEINPENQITLILKTLCGFSTAEIAKAFLTSEDTISKRLYRTKEFFRENKIKPEFPPPDQLNSKTASVLKAIYLIFNEGYHSTHSDQIIRKDLLDQAMYLCRLLCENHKTQLPEVYAAMALMCFHASRTDSRVSETGEIILLSEQDRNKWDYNLIIRGHEYMNQAASGEGLTNYHIEAAIAFEHCTALNFESTNWERILFYYDWLMRLQPNAIIALNRMIVVYKTSGEKETLMELEHSPYLKEWQKNYLYHSLLGEIYSIGQKEKAKQSYESALKLTQSEAEKKLLRKKIAGL
jgi:RNA polymerase sigma-70 factor (ECF subfamily)